MVDNGLQPNNSIMRRWPFCRRFKLCKYTGSFVSSSDSCISQKNGKATSTLSMLLSTICSTKQNPFKVTFTWLERTPFSLFLSLILWTSCWKESVNVCIIMKSSYGEKLEIKCHCTSDGQLRSLNFTELFQVSVIYRKRICVYLL